MTGCECNHCSHVTGWSGLQGADVRVTGWASLGLGLVSNIMCNDPGTDHCSSCVTIHHNTGVTWARGCDSCGHSLIGSGAFKEDITKTSSQSILRVCRDLDCLTPCVRSRQNKRTPGDPNLWCLPNGIIEIAGVTWYSGQWLVAALRLPHNQRSWLPVDKSCQRFIQIFAC